MFSIRLLDFVHEKVKFVDRCTFTCKSNVVLKVSDNVVIGFLLASKL